MLKICLQCNREFKTYFRAAIYCGKACQNASQVKAKTYTCTNCEKEFQRPNHAIKDKFKGKEYKNRFCNVTCQREWMAKNHLNTICLTCHKEFHPKMAIIRHCSKACRDKGLITKIEYTCNQCGKIFEGSPAKNRKFCSHACSENFRIGANHHNTKGGTYTKHGARWKLIRKRIIERDKACRLCGATSNPSGRALSVHHIDARRNYELVDFSNEDSNLVTLCNSCHMRVEMAITHGRAASLPTWLRPPA